jgi:hypothetical protein
MLGNNRTAGTKVGGDLTDGEPIVPQESKDFSLRVGSAMARKIASSRLCLLVTMWLPIW